MHRHDSILPVVSAKSSEKYLLPTTCLYLITQALTLVS